MERYPEIRLDLDLARQVDARLVAGETFSSLVRSALDAYLAPDAADARPKPRRRRAGPVLKSLNVALAASRFEDHDAAAIGLARHLAERLDEHPSDAKYLAQRLLSVLEALRLTPQARLGVLSAAAQPEADAEPTVLGRLRLQSMARREGEPALAAYLALRDSRGYDADDEAAQRYAETKAPNVRAVTEALAQLVRE